MKLVSLKGFNVNSPEQSSGIIIFHKPTLKGLNVRYTLDLDVMSPQSLCFSQDSGAIRVMKLMGTEICQLFARKIYYVVFCVQLGKKTMPPVLAGA